MNFPRMEKNRPNALAVLRFLGLVIGSMALLIILYLIDNEQIYSLTRFMNATIWMKTVASNQNGTKSLQTANVTQKKTSIGKGIPVQRSQKNHSMYTCEPTTECARLRKFFKDSWNFTKPKAAVYILISPRDVKELDKSLRDLEVNFLSRFSYPVIIFHEKDFVPHVPKVRNITKLNMFFQEIKFDVPNIYPPVGKLLRCMNRDLGFRHMCRFQAKTIYELPIMLQLEYYLRLDAHSYITKPVPYDLFKSMKDKGMVYMYPCIGHGYPDCVMFMRDAVKNYLDIKGIKPEFFGEWENTKIYYNNFEMARMDAFTAPGYQDYINFLDHLGGIYYNRWGDADIKSFAVSIFVPKNKTEKMPNIGYFHRGEDIEHGPCFK